MAQQRINISMVENVFLVWLDENINQVDDECRNTITELRRIVNRVNTFTDPDECVNFLSENDHDKIWMIISGALGQHIVPMVHDMSRVESIFIFCNNLKHHEQWAEKWSKIQGVFTNITAICGALKHAAHECERNTIGISFMSKHGADASIKNANQLDRSFMYTQILKEILLTIQFEEQHIKEFIDYCREIFADNAHELNNIKQFERKYRNETPIWWYTCESFLYPMLNRALRMMNMNITIKMGFFVVDLHRCIQQLHSEQFDSHHFGEVFEVYRGQGLSKIDFEQMMNTKGGLIAFNNFLSTSKARNVSLKFARRAITNPDLVGILFVITIDPSISSTPFASINDVSCFKKEEDEVLFSMHTVFRICEITQMAENNRLWLVELTLTSDNDQELCAITESMRKETEGSSGWFRLGRLLIKMGHADQAKTLYKLMRKQASNKIEEANILHQLGVTYDELGEYEKALSNYKKSLNIRQKMLPPYDPDVATSHRGIANAYNELHKYSKSLSSHEKALQIQEESLPSNLPDLAKCYNNIGIMYHDTKNFSKSLSSHEKALQIQEESLPPNHPALAASYNNIALVYSSMGENSKALFCYKKALEIKETYLSENHPNLASSYNNIGVLYGNMENYEQALSFCERAVFSAKCSLPANHHDLQIYERSLKKVKKKL